MSAGLDAVLGANPLFRHLGDRRRRRLAQQFCRRRYRPGEVIVRQGDTSLSFYVVLSGRVGIMRHPAVVEDGPTFFGEVEALGDLPRTATVVALEPTECALLGKWDFLQAMGR